MLQELRKSWREFKASKPGERFQDLNERRERAPHPKLKKVLSLLGALLVVAAGVLSWPIPGIPSELIILLGIALFAQAWRPGARALDRLEVKLRPTFLRLYRRFWEPLPRGAKVFLSLLWCALLGLAGWGVHRLIAD